MARGRPTSPKKESANPPPPEPDTDLRAYEYETMPFFIFQWMDGGREAFIRIDDQHVVSQEDAA